MIICPAVLASGTVLILLLCHLIESLDKLWGKYQTHDSVM